MERFLVVFAVLVVACGLAIHLKVELPWFASWVGNLPGDLMIKKDHITIYLPLATSVVLSIFVSFVLSLFFGKKN